MRHWIDIVSDSKLFEMAYQRKRFREVISTLADPISEHVFKLVFVPNHPARQHWQHEVTGWFAKIAKGHVKPSRSKLPWDEYYLLMFDEPIDEENMVGLGELIRTRDGLPAQDRDPKLAYTQIKVFYEAVIDQIVTNDTDPVMYQKLTTIVATL